MATTKIKKNGDKLELYVEVSPPSLARDGGNKDHNLERFGLNKARVMLTEAGHQPGSALPGSVSEVRNDVGKDSDMMYEGVFVFENKAKKPAPVAAKTPARVPRKNTQEKKKEA